MYVCTCTVSIAMGFSTYMHLCMYVHVLCMLNFIRAIICVHLKNLRMNSDVYTTVDQEIFVSFVKFSRRLIFVTQGYQQKYRQGQSAHTYMYDRSQGCTKRRAFRRPSVVSRLLPESAE